MGFTWNEFNNIDEFLNEFERYVKEYFTKKVILVNELHISEYDGGDIVEYWLGTPSTDVIFKVYTPDRIVMDSFVEGFIKGKNGARYDLLDNIFNGQKLTEEQFKRLDSLFRELYDYYYKNRKEFRKARAEAFMNLITATKGKVLEVMGEELGDDVTTAVVMKELGVDDEER